MFQTCYIFQTLHFRTYLSNLTSFGLSYFGLFIFLFIRWSCVLKLNNISWTIMFQTCQVLNLTCIGVAIFRTDSSSLFLNLTLFRLPCFGLGMQVSCQFSNWFILLNSPCFEIVMFRTYLSFSFSDLSSFELGMYLSCHFSNWSIELVFLTQRWSDCHVSNLPCFGKRHITELPFFELIHRACFLNRSRWFHRFATNAVEQVCVCLEIFVSLFFRENIFFVFSRSIVRFAF